MAAKVCLKGFSVIDCVVCNISSGGACIRVASQQGVPNEFDLVINKNNSIKRCRVAWRKADRVGLQFIGESGAPRAAVGGAAL